MGGVLWIFDLIERSSTQGAKTCGSFVACIPCAGFYFCRAWVWIESAVPQYTVQWVTSLWMMLMQYWWKKKRRKKKRCHSRLYGRNMPKSTRIIKQCFQRESPMSFGCDAGSAFIFNFACQWQLVMFDWHGNKERSQLASEVKCNCYMSSICPIFSID